MYKDTNTGKPMRLVSAEENSRVARAMRAWLNEYPNLPTRKIEYEYLSADSGLTLTTAQAAYKTRSYIDGSYQAQYQYRLLYRLIAATTNERLAADELLNDIAAWAEARADKPQFGEGIKTLRITRNTVASIVARYEDGSEDHDILMTVLYEVN